MANTDGWLQGQALKQRALDAVNTVKQTAGQAYNYGTNLVKGLSGEPVVPATPGAALPGEGPVVATQPAAGGTGNLPPQEPPVQAAAPGPTPRRGSSIPPLTPDEAAQARQPGFVNDATKPASTPASTPEKGLRFGAKVGRSATLAGLAVGEATDPNTLNAVNPFSDMSGKDRTRQLARSALRTGGGILGGAAGSLLGGVGAVAGGYGGYYLGGKAADFLVGPEETQQSASGGVQPPANAGSVPSAVQPGSDVKQPQPQAYAEAPNENTIQNVQTGKVSPVGGRGLRGTIVYPNSAGGGGSVTQNLSSLYQGKTGNARGLGGLAALGSFGAVSRLAKNENDANTNRTNLEFKNQELGLRDQEIGLRSQALSNATNKFNYDVSRDQQQDNQKDLDAAINDYAVKTSPQQGAAEGVLDKDAYKNRIDSRKADVADRVRFSINDRMDGKNPSQVRRSEIQKLFIANDIRERGEQGRSAFWRSLGEYFGDQRFNSRNLYTYMPESAVRTATGTYDIKTANGNHFSVKDVGSGQYSLLGFNATSPNAPVDTEVMKLITPLIKKAEGQ